MSIKLVLYAFYCLDNDVNNDTDKYDGGSRRHIQCIRDPQATKTVDPTNQNAENNHAFEAMGKYVGGHLRNRQQADCQHNADHSQCRHDGHGGECHHQILDDIYRKSLGACETAVKGDAQDALV